MNRDLLLGFSRFPLSAGAAPPRCRSRERKSKITASRKLLLKSLMLAKAKEEWDQEIVDKQAEKERYLSERVTPLHTSGLSLSQLQVLLSLRVHWAPWEREGPHSPLSCFLGPRTCAGSCTRRWKLWMRRDTTLKRNATITPGRSALWKWETGARTWRPCRAWRAGRRCSTLPSPPRGSDRSTGKKTVPVPAASLPSLLPCPFVPVPEFPLSWNTRTAVWKGVLSFFLPAVPSALPLHSVPSAATGRAVPKGQCHPPLPALQSCPLCPPCPLCPVAPRDVPASQMCIKGLSWAEAVCTPHWGTLPRARPGHPAVSPCWHSDPTPWAHTGFGLVPSSPGLLLRSHSPAEPPGPTQGQPCWAQGCRAPQAPAWGNRAACSPSPLLCFWKSPQSSRHQLPSSCPPQALQLWQLGHFKG
uniref:Uncharacterized protein n=1 Tax=Junco hyemalis TaxID=40217 RepID=A0A8C5NPW5_JUNHY